MPARVRSATVFGIEAADVFVEVDVAPGLPSFTTVGLPDSAVRGVLPLVEAAGPPAPLSQGPAHAPLR